MFNFRSRYLALSVGASLLCSTVWAAFQDNVYMFSGRALVFAYNGFVQRKQSISLNDFLKKTGPALKLPATFLRRLGQDISVDFSPKQSHSQGQLVVSFNSNQPVALQYCDLAGSSAVDVSLILYPTVGSKIVVNDFNLSNSNLFDSISARQIIAQNLNLQYEFNPKDGQKWRYPDHFLIQNAVHLVSISQVMNYVPLTFVLQPSGVYFSSPLTFQKFVNFLSFEGSNKLQEGACR